MQECNINIQNLTSSQQVVLRLCSCFLLCKLSCKRSWNRGPVHW